VTPDDVRAFAATHMANDTFVVLVGDANQFADTVGERFGTAIRIPEAQLDFGRAEMMR
jgi:hypothetical protein